MIVELTDGELAAATKALRDLKHYIVTFRARKVNANPDFYDDMDDDIESALAKLTAVSPRDAQSNGAALHAT